MRTGADYKTWLCGYAATLADFHRLNGQSTMVYEAVVQAGVNYHDFKDAGAEIADLGEIAKARDEWKRTRQVSRETLTP